MKSEPLLEVSAFPYHPLSARITGGSPALEATFPFQIHISDACGQYICGGTVLNTVFVHTAAHCLVNRNSAQLRVTAGDHDRHRVEWTKEQSRAIETVIIHENYKPGPLQEGNGANDTALVKVSSPFIFNDYVQAIPFIRRPSRWKVTVSGWGSTFEGAPSSVILQKVEVPIVPRPQCQEGYGHLFNITDYHVCAGSPRRDSCRGDSGGPLSGYLLPNYERILVGITTAGLLCHDLYAGAPGVYTNLSKHAGWIENRMATHAAKTWTSCSNKSDFFCPKERKCIPVAWVRNGQSDCMNGEDEKNIKPVATPRPNPKSKTIPKIVTMPTTKPTTSKPKVTTGPLPSRTGKSRESPLTKLVEYLKTLTTRKPKHTTTQRPKPSTKKPNVNQGSKKSGAIISCPGEFKCPGEPKCISRLWLNNGYPDCGNGEDERLQTGGRSAHGCHAYQFLCHDASSSGCVPSRWWCLGSQPTVNF